MWNNFLYDRGLVPYQEPFKRLVHQGYILGSNGIKMGKRYPEYVVNPNDIVRDYGADALRVYEMFMGPLEADKPWSTQGIEGTKRWLDRVWRLFIELPEYLSDENDHSLDYVYNYTVKKVSNDIDSLNLNTAIAQMMIFINECYKTKKVYREYAIDFVQMFSCFAPHLGNEIYERLTGKTDLAYRPWPSFDEEKIKLDETEIVVQINGKVRAKFMAQSGLDDDKLYELALAQENIQKYLAGQTIKKHFVIKSKIINIVI